MRNVKEDTGVRKYLDSVGVLQHGTEAEIRAAKKQYWKLYDTQYKREKRKQKREYLVTFNRSELALIISAAKAKGLEVPEYMRQATRADMANTYVTPCPYLLKETSQLLAWYQNSIRNIAEKDKKNWLGVNRNYDTLEAIITKLQAEIKSLFKNGPPLIKVIEETLERNPSFKDSLINLIAKYP